ncbi:MAG: S41 family peptidase, partial [Chthonomonadales bacterium]
MQITNQSRYLALLTLWGPLFNLLPLQAQKAIQSSSSTIDGTVRAEVIDVVLKKLNSDYIFPDVAKKMELTIRDRMHKLEYDAFHDGKLFAEKLTNDLQAVSHDKHLSVRFSANALPKELNKATSTPSERLKLRTAFLRRGAAINWGFEKVERLPGNIGYLDFRFFGDPEQAAETLASAMNFLANTDALIMDMRENEGGDPAMVAVACSYLFDSVPIHLNDLYWRPDASTHQYWTLPHVSG